MNELQTSSVTSAAKMSELLGAPKQSDRPNDDTLEIGGMKFKFTICDIIDPNGSSDSTDGPSTNWSSILKKLFQPSIVTTSEIYKNSQQNRDSPVMVSCRSLGAVETEEEPPKPVSGASLDQPVSTMSNTEPTDQIANEVVNKVADEIFSEVVDKAVSKETSKTAEERVNDEAAGVAGLTISECPSGGIREQIKTQLTSINQVLETSDNIKIDIMFNHSSHTLMYDISTDKLTGEESIPDALKDEIKGVSIKSMRWEHKKEILKQTICAISHEVKRNTNDEGEANYEYSLVSSINVSNQEVASESKESDTIQLTTESGNTYQVSFPELLRSYSEEERAAGRTPLKYEQDSKEYMKALCEYHERNKLGLVAEPKFKAQQNMYDKPKVIFFS